MVIMANVWGAVVANLEVIHEAFSFTNMSEVGERELWKCLQKFRFYYVSHIKKNNKMGFMSVSVSAPLLLY